VEFLKRHYEKLILLTLSVISILTVLHIISIVGRTKEVKDSDLKIPTRQPDYVVHDATSADFITAQLISNTGLMWDASASRLQDNESKNYFSDLVNVFKMARCPHCSKIIPFYYFSDSTCPECGKELKTPLNTGKRRIRMITENDSDGDGISDSDEERFGFNSGDPSDALHDADGNGFSNLYEIENSFDPRMPNNCPPLWYRLRFRGVGRIELPLRLTSIDTGGNSDPKKWDALIKLQRTNYRGQMVWRDSSYNIGDTLQFDGRNYQIVSMSLGVKSQNNAAKDGASGKASVVLREVVESDGNAAKTKPEELVLTEGQPAYSNDRRAILEDIGIPADEHGKRPTYGLRIGDRFTIGGAPGNPFGRAVPPLSLRLVKFDEKNKTALLANARARSGVDATLDAQGRRMLVTEHSEIPEDLWVSASGANVGDKKKNASGSSRSNSPRRN